MITRKTLASTSVLILAIGLGAAWTRHSSDRSVQPQPQFTSPTVTVTQEQPEIEEAIQRASSEAGFPIRVPDASTLGLAVKAVQLDGVRHGIPAGSATNPRRVVVYFQPLTVDAKNMPATPTGLSMRITFFSGSWDTSPLLDEKGEPLELVERLPFDVEGYTLLRITSKQVPDQGAIYHLQSETRTFSVRVGHELEPPPGEKRPSDDQMLPILYSLARNS
jgi:hypothetical protein